MDHRYKLTIIVTCYNQEEHLAETINSIFSRVVNYPFRVIITDDCSRKDRSVELIESYDAGHDNVEALLAKKNEGYLANVLRAKARADTKYLCLLDVDDYWTDVNYLQRAYDFLESHPEHAIYEANVKVVKEGEKTSRRFVSRRFKSGTYSKEMYLADKPIPITQTTGMFFRNRIFANGIPIIMRDAVGTRSERSFEGDTGRFVMHLKEGFAYYDDRIVGVYRVTDDGIWTSLPNSLKQLITARFYPDFYRYYGWNVGFFANRAYSHLQGYLVAKRKELEDLTRCGEFVDEYERLMANDVYRFCKPYEDEIACKKTSTKEKVKQSIRILMS